MIRMIVALMALGLVSTGWAQAPENAKQTSPVVSKSQPASSPGNAHGRGRPKVSSRAPIWRVEDKNTSEGVFTLAWEMPGDPDYFELMARKANQEETIRVTGDRHEFMLSARGTYWFKVRGCWATPRGTSCSENSDRLRVTHSNGNGNGNGKAAVANKALTPSVEISSINWVNQSTNTYELTWFQTGSNGAYYYQIRRHYTQWLSQLITIYNSSTLSRQFTNETGLSFDVRAYNFSGWGDWSAPVSWNFEATITSETPTSTPQASWDNPIYSQYSVAWDYGSTTIDGAPITFYKLRETLPDASTTTITQAPATIAFAKSSGPYGTYQYEFAGCTQVGCSNYSAPISWTVDDPATGPLVTNPGDQAHRVGESVTLQIEATDAQQDPITYSASGLPTGLNIDSNSGLISGTLPFGSETTFATTVTVSDATTSRSKSFNWVVSEITEVGQIPFTDANLAQCVLDAAGGDTSTSIADITSLFCWFTNISDLEGIQYLSLLSVVYLDHNAITDITPLTLIPNLTWMRLSDNQIASIPDLSGTGIIFMWIDSNPVTDLSGIAGTASLRQLYADNTGITDIAFVTSLSGLSGLSISSTAVSDMTPLAGHPGLTSLTVNTTPVSNLSPLSGMASLNYLDVSSSSVTDVSALSVLDSLTILNLAQTSVTNLSPLATTNITSLTLDNLTTVDLSQLSGLSSIETLNLYSVDSLLSPQTISEFTALQSLNIAYVGLTDLDFLTGLSNLNTLTANDSDLSDPIDLQGLSGHLDLVTVNLGDSNVVDIQDLVTLARAQTSPMATVTLSGNSSLSCSQLDQLDFEVATVHRPISCVPQTDFDPPFFDQQPANQTWLEGDSVSVAIQATDPKGGTVAYAAGGLPTGLSIDRDSGVITGIVAPGSMGVWTSEISASDGDSIVSASVDWDIGSGAPVVTDPGDQLNLPGDTLQLQIVATDPNSPVLTYSAVGLPAGVAIDSNSGLISGTPLWFGGNHVVTVTVSDGLMTTSVTFNWRLNNPPDIASPVSMYSTAGDPVVFELPAADVDGDALTFTAVFPQDGNWNNFSIDLDTGIITGTTALTTPPASYTVPITVSDGVDTFASSIDWEIGPSIGMGVRGIQNLRFEADPQNPGNPDRFILKWGYPQFDFGTQTGKPDKFVIISSLASTDENAANPIPDVPAGSVWLEDWESTVIVNSDHLGTGYFVKACSDSGPCGRSSFINVDQDPTAGALSVPANLAINSTDNNAFQLSWDAVNGADYYAVEEIGALGQSTSYSIEPTISLRRKTPGNYQFSVRACTRDRENGDDCSAQPVPQSVDVAGIAELVAPFNVRTLNYNDGNNFEIAWIYGTSSFNAALSSPDYFLLSKVRGDDNIIRSYKIIAHNNIGMWRSELFQGFERGLWVVRACQHTGECGPASDVHNNQLGQHTVPENTPTAPATTTENPGGPGELRPGEWWDPDHKGTGWSFYWANQLRYPSTHHLYKNAYDLYGFWMTYRKIHCPVDANGDPFPECEASWQPVWLYAELKQSEDCVDPLIPSSDCYTGTLYLPKPHEEDHGDPTQHHTDVGNVSVYLGADNNHARVAGQINDSKGAMSPIFDLDLEYFGLFTTGPPNLGSNSLDHRSGLYWLVGEGDDERPYINDDYATLNWIDGTHESMMVLFYDDLDNPIWVRGDKDAGEENNEHFFLNVVTEGFDPIDPTPDEFLAEDGVSINPEFYKYVGNAERTFYDNDSLRNDVWASIDLSSQVSPRLRTASLNIGTQSAPVELEKALNFHDIDFFINGHDEFVPDCTLGPDIDSCSVELTWFSDGFFPGATVYRCLKDDPNRAFCDEVGSGWPAVERMQAVLDEEGEFIFELRKSNDADAPVLARTIPMEVTRSVVPKAVVDIISTPPTAADLHDHLDAAHDDSIGSGGGTPGVSGGAATYSIPIVVPPGRQGMQPNLSFSYSSRSGNGPLGMGWSLSGLSSIHRCSKTVAQDGQMRAVVYDQSDRLCLDGQRLVRVPLNTDDSNYWAADAEYRTELDSFARITAVSSGHPVCGNSGFMVEAKSGMRRCYTQGVQPEGVSNPSSWMMTREVGRSGNLIEYQYGSYGSGEVLINEIRYTGHMDPNGGQINSGTRVVLFDYDAERTDTGFAYKAGGLTEQTMRLRQVKTCEDSFCIDTTIAREYTLAYTNSFTGGENAATGNVADTSGRSLLVDVQHCAYDSDGVSHCRARLPIAGQSPPDQFIWSQRSLLTDTDLPFEFQQPILGSTNEAAVDWPQGSVFLPNELSDLNQGFVRMLEDFDGDGIRELQWTLLRRDASATDPSDRLVLGDAKLISVNEDFDVVKEIDFPRGLLKGFGAGQQRMDFNNDGRVDLIGIEGGKIKVAIWNRDPNHNQGTWETVPDGQEDDAFKMVESTISANPIGSPESDLFYLADFNGDSLPDVLLNTVDLSCPLGRRLELYINEEPPELLKTLGDPSNSELTFGLAQSIGCIKGTGSVTLRDLDGDGYPDVTFGLATPVDQAINNYLFFRPDGAIDGTTDGLVDIEERSATDLGLASDHPSERYHLMVDLNGDGLDDYLFAKYQTGWMVSFNTGKLGGLNSLFTAAEDLESPLGSAIFSESCPMQQEHDCSLKYGAMIKAMDFDGDGRMELLIPREQRLLEYCVIEVLDQSDAETWTDVCGNDLMSTAIPDASVFEFDVLRMVSEPGGHSFKLIEKTGLFGDGTSVVGDVNGDGLDDLVSRLGKRFLTDKYSQEEGTCNEAPIDPYYVNVCQVVCSTTNPGNCPFDLNQHQGKLYVALNKGATNNGTSTKASDFLISAIDELGNEAKWTYNPLSSDADRGASQPTSVPLYEIPKRTGGDGYIDQDSSGEHFYFTSSMYVVSRFDVSNGLVDPGGFNLFNSTYYGYEEAVYNRAGRGFQGFRTVISEQDYSDPLEEGTRSISIFHQMYPKAGRLETSFSRPATDVFDKNISQAISSSTQVWAEKLSLDGVPYLVQEVASSGQRDLNNRQLIVTQTTVDPTYDDYGNVGTVTTTVADAGYLTHSTMVVNDYDYQAAIVDQWWLTKLDKTTTTQGVLYESNHTVPVVPGGLSVPSPETDRIRTQYTVWNQALRKPMCVFDIGQQITENPTCSSPVDFFRQPGSKETGVLTKFDYDETAFGFGELTSVTAIATTETTGSPTLPRTTEYEYFGSHYFVENLTNPLGHRTHTVTDEKTGQPETITILNDNGLASDDRSTAIKYDAFGLEVERFYPTSLPGNVANPTNQYAPRSSRRVSADPSVCETPVNVDARYCVITITDGAPISRAYFDSRGRQVTTLSDGFGDGQQIRTDVEYNARGQVTYATQPYFNGQASYGTITEYDVLGRMLSKSEMRQSPTAALDSYYAYNGLTTDVVVESDNVSCSMTDGALVSSLCVSRTYSSQGQLLQTVDAHGQSTHFWADGAGNPVIIQDPDGNPTQATYDGLGNRTELFDPNMGHSTYTYNGFGEVLEQTDANTNETRFEYDGLGRLTVRTSFDGSNEVEDMWEYDVNVQVDGSPQVRHGLLARESRVLNPMIAPVGMYDRVHHYDSNLNSTGFSVWLFDDFQLFDDISTRFFEVSVVNDDYFGRPISLVYPNEALALYYLYNKSGNLVEEGESEDLFDPSIFLRRVETMDAFGNVTQESYANGRTANRAFNPTTGQMASTHLDTGYVNLRYEYDSFGNLKLIDDLANGSNEQFGYDKLHRLKWTQQLRGLTEISLDSYGYDALGNITQKSDYAADYHYGGSTENGDYPCTYVPGPNAVSGADLNESGPTTFCYDKNGNMIQIQGQGAASFIASYDTYNLPISVTRDAVESTFAYGPNQQRYLQEGLKKVFYVDKLFEEIDNTENKYYIGDYLVWTLEYDSVAETDIGRQRYIHRDRLGSVVAMTNTAGILKGDASRGFDPFGKPRDRDGTESGDGLNRDDITARGFTDHEHLDSARLIHMNGRAYDYSLGRFLSVDPIIQSPSNSQSLNPYSYIMNNPLSGTDPTGYRSLCGAGGAGGNCYSIDMSKSTSFNFHNGENRNGSESRETTLASSAALNAFRGGIQSIGAPWLIGFDTSGTEVVSLFDGVVNVKSLDEARTDLVVQVLKDLGTDDEFLEVVVGGIREEVGSVDLLVDNGTQHGLVDGKSITFGLFRNERFPIDTDPIEDLALEAWNSGNDALGDQLFERVDELQRGDLPFSIERLLIHELHHAAQPTQNVSFRRALAGDDQRQYHGPAIKFTNDMLQRRYGSKYRRRDDTNFSTGTGPKYRLQRESELNDN